MKPPSDPPYELEVSRADLVQALKIVARAIGKRHGEATLRFEDGYLSIDAAKTVADAPARGTWPLPIYVGISWVRRLARRLPAGDPIQLRVDAGRLCANRYSEPCAGTPKEQPVPLERSAIYEDFLISGATLILKHLRVERPAVENLVAEALARGTSSWSRGFVAWSEDEKKVAIIVEKAWMKLAPFGVGMTDIRRLVDKTLHDAWKTDREK
jgi:hypothetical protein